MFKTCANATRKLDNTKIIVLQVMVYDCLWASSYLFRSLIIFLFTRRRLNDTSTTKTNIKPSINAETTSAVGISTSLA